MVAIVTWFPFHFQLHFPDQYLNIKNLCANRYCESHGSTQFKLTLFLFRGIMKIWFAVTLAVLGFINKKLTKIIAPTLKRADECS